MADVPSPLFKLNYPIETAEARAFWSSNQKLNRIKAIIAFSLTLENANDNLRRYGYSKHFRKRALNNFCMYVNQPAMTGIPFHSMDDDWWIEMPYRETSLCEVEPINFNWQDSDIWNDTADNWREE